MIQFSGNANDNAYLRDQNRRKVLSEIRQRVRVARVDIADRVGLSPATVTAVTAELLAERYIVELEGSSPNEPRRGRPRILLSLNPDRLYVAGAKLSDQALTVAILNFTGELVAEGAVALPRPVVALDECMDLLDTALEKTLSDASLKESNVSALGLGIPGFVDHNSGVCQWSPVIHDTPANVGGRLGERFECAVFVDNDANLVTLAELWFGKGQGRSNFIVVTIEHGVGMGIVINGKLYRGNRSMAAEFGHTKVQYDGALCRCGQRGCLEAYVADYALSREASTILSANVSIDPQDRHRAMDELYRLAGEGHPQAHSVFVRAGRMLGIGIANLVNIFDPECVILSGARMRNELIFSDEIAKEISRNTIKHGGDDPAIEVHRWGDRLWAQGAGALALEGISSGA